MSEMQEVYEKQREDLRQAMRASAQKKNETEEAIRENTRLSREGMAQAATENYQKAKERYDTLLEKYDGLRISQRDDHHETLFKPKKLISQPDYVIEEKARQYHQYTMEADGRLVVGEDGNFDDSQLVRYMTMARHSGNAEAEKAAFWVGHSRGATGAVRDYLEYHPEMQEAYDAYREIDQEINNPSAAQLFVQRWETLAPTIPGEMRDYEHNAGEGPWRDLFVQNR
jgi:hypothetical protein